jgi:hypothetical protein
VVISGYKWFPTRYCPSKKPLAQKGNQKNNLIIMDFKYKITKRELQKENCKKN